MHIDQQVIDLATRIQRRRDFTAHVIGFLSGAIVLGLLLLAGMNGAALYIAAVLTWATALSFQHFRHVLRGPVTASAIGAEAPGSIADPSLPAKRNGVSGCAHPLTPCCSGASDPTPKRRLGAKPNAPERDNLHWGFSGIGAALNRPDSAFFRHTGPVTWESRSGQAWK